MASISIVIPTHQRPHLVRRAVESALRATGQSNEVVVVGDHDVSAEAALSDLLDGSRCRFLENTGRRGAAATRNAGVSASKGELILFLDDDDEMIEGYPQRVLQSARTRDAVWGFSSQQVRAFATLPPHVLKRTGWDAGGFAGSSVPFRRKIGAASAGFWIEKILFVKLGGFVEDKLIDEDTDLCCRLLSRGIQPWFETDPGTVLDRTADVIRLTNSENKEIAALDYLDTFKRNYMQLGGERGAVSFLATRAQRMILRARRKDLVSEVAGASVGLPLRWLLAWKRIVYRMRGR